MFPDQGRFRTTNVRNPAARTAFREVLSAINLVVLLSCSPFTLPLSPAGIRDADRLRPEFPPLGDHAEYGDPKFLALECLRRIRECRAPSWSGGGLDCNECPQRLRIVRRCLSFSGIRKSKHSRRMVPTRRSQKAFAWGAWNGVFKILSPIDFRAESSSDE